MLERGEGRRAWLQVSAHRGRLDLWAVSARRFLPETTGRSAAVPLPQHRPLDAVPSLQQNRGDSGPLTSLQPWARRRRTDRAPGGQARKMDRPLARDAAGGQAGRQATSSWTNGHRGGQARPPRCPPSPRSAPAPAAHPPGLEHRFISKCRHNPTIGFLITGSNVRRINILTN